MFIDEIKRVIGAEEKAISVLKENINYDELNEVCQLLKNTKGKIIFLAVGKSGHIGKKLAATFASTGTPSFFVHGTEACHGDLGMIEKDDAVILISNSGSTKEVTQNIAPIRRIGATTIAFTSKRESPLSMGCDYRIIYPSLNEADPNNLAPSNSSTMTLVLGDAIALALSKSYNFTRNDFHKFHPNGALGESLAKEKNNE